MMETNVNYPDSMLNPGAYLAALALAMLDRFKQNFILFSPPVRFW